MSDDSSKSMPQTMRDLSKLKENLICADCNNKDPDWTSINLGIFVCIECAGVHRNLGVHHSKVRSIDLDTTCWDPKQIEFMFSIGNERAKKEYEFNAPKYYVRPTETENPLARENWIRAKYVRKEFMKVDDEKDDEHPAIFNMPEPSKQSFMWKKNPRGVWQKRWFCLLGRMLRWFDEPSDSYAKGEVDLSQCKIELPAKPDNEHRFNFEIHSASKVYTVAADDNDTMFSWVHALRRSNVYYSVIKTSSAADEKVEESDPKSVTYSSLKKTKEGVLSKQGGRFATWKSRLCVLSDGNLWYFKAKPLDSDNPEGGLNLKHCDVVDPGATLKKAHTFLIVNPARTYFFEADSGQGMRDWMVAIRQDINQLTKRDRIDFRNY